LKAVWISNNVAMPGCYSLVTFSCKVGKESMSEMEKASAFFVFSK